MKPIALIATVAFAWGQPLRQLNGPNRPQDPKPPYAYQSIEVSYENKADRVKLAGTLTMPKTGGPFSAAILITAGFPQDRDQTMMGHKPFLVIADYLTRRGIAVLRVDDRGVGGSTGNSMQTTIGQMAADVLAGVDFLKERKDIDAKHIGVIGHSEGGTVGPLAASRSPEIAFVVMLAGAGVPIEQILYKQTETNERVAHVSEQNIKRNRKVREMMVRVLKSDLDQHAAAAKIRAEWAQMKENLPDADRENLESVSTWLEAELSFSSAQEFRSQLGQDPSETLRKLKVPVLALNGSRDVQSFPQQNLTPIVAALTAGANPDFMDAELPGLSHMFQTCKQCTMAEYGTIAQTFSPTALEIMGDWILRHTH
jgi:pimeloyl-ACP methyl ester carboxylesterase